MYQKEQQLNLGDKPIRVTKEVYDILRKKKRETKLSMAKLVCNLVLEKYGD
jgi:hypothetical protein